MNTAIESAPSVRAGTISVDPVSICGIDASGFDALCLGLEEHRKHMETDLGEGHDNTAHEEYGGVRNLREQLSRLNAAIEVLDDPQRGDTWELPLTPSEIASALSWQVSDALYRIEEVWDATDADPVDPQVPLDRLNAALPLRMRMRLLAVDSELDLTAVAFRNREAS